MSNSDHTTLPFVVEDTFQTAVKRLVQQTERVVSDRKLSMSERHNTFTLYTVLQLLFATGHRPVVDPFGLVQHISVEHRLCLIADKVTDESRAFRLVGIPELAVRQLREYVRYLDVLSKKLCGSPESKELGVAIANFLDSERSRFLPLFFMMPDGLVPACSILPNVIESYLKEYIDIPCNFGRHWLATELGWKGSDASEIQRLLGHLETLDHPYGRYSLLPPKRSALETSDKIDDLLAVAGFGFVKFPIRSSDVDHAQDNQERIKIFENREVAHYVRKRKRQEKLAAVREYVDRVREMLQPSIDRRHITKDDVDLSIAKLDSLTSEQGGSLAWCQRLFYRWLDSIRRRGIRVDARRLYALENEKSPFSENTLIDYEAAHLAREKFNDLVSIKGIDRQTLAKKAASATVSLALNGQIGSRPILDSMYSDTCSWYLNEGELVLYVGQGKDKDKDKGASSYELPPRIWEPDKTSAAILLSLPDSLKFSGDSRKPYQSCLRKIVREVGGNSRSPTQWLTKMASSLTLIEQPGIVRSISREQIVHQGLSTEVRRRLMTGKINPNVNFDDLERINVLDFVEKVCFQEQNFECDSSADQYIEWLKAQLKAIEEGRNTYFDKEHGEAKRRHSKSLDAKKRRLINTLEWYEKNASMDAKNALPRLSRDVLAINRYVIKLAESGTQFKARLAWSYFRRLIRSITIHLFKHEAGRVISSLDESEYEELYFHVLDNCKASSRVERFVALREFHYVLMDTFHQDNVDWAYVLGLGEWDGIDALASIDANIVSYSDYMRALTLVRNARALNPNLRIQLSFLLLLGFRFGLRWSEALYLERRDIRYNCEAGRLEIRVRPNIHRPLKTRYSRRTLPLLGGLSDKESDLLTNALEISNAIHPKNPRALLFNDGVDSEKCIDRSHGSYMVNRALKLATGDAGVRFHHLRHSQTNVLFYMATRAIGTHAGLYKKIGECIIAGRKIVNRDYQKLWRNERTTHGRLRLVADYMGHGSLGSMCAYIRLYPELQGVCVASNGILPSVEMLSAYLGVSKDSVWKRNQRQNAANPAEISDIEICGKKVIQGEQINGSMDPDMEIIPPPLLGNSLDRSLSLLDLELLVRKLYYDSDMEKICKYASLLEVNVDGFLEASARAATLVSYHRFERSNQKATGRKPAMGFYVEKSEETQNVRMQLSVIQRRLDASDNIDHFDEFVFLHVAGSAYRSGHRNLRFLSSVDAQNFVSGLTMLGVDGVRLVDSKMMGKVNVQHDKANLRSLSGDLGKPQFDPWLIEPKPKSQKWLTEIRALNFGGSLLATASALYRVLYLFALYRYYNRVQEDITL